MTDTPQLRPSAAVAVSLGTALIGVGIVLNLLSRTFDGFAQGLFLGAGVTLVVLGVVTVSGTLRRRLRNGAAPAVGEHDDTWLPSRDGDR